MEDKQLNEKESLELIAQMIRNTQKKMEKGSGIPFLIWGYVTIAVSLTVWYLLGKTGNPNWNFLWFAIPVIGFPTMLLAMRKKTALPKTYIDKVISYVWIVVGVSALIPSMAIAVIHDFPVLFLVVLLISIGTAITGFVIKFLPLVISGFMGMLLSILCLTLRASLDSILVFAALFLLVQVIPGHILNYKSRRSHV
ncbi:hypothetical protein SDC9_97853 [bioreactor metagenome]|uniref:Uncharacterized protein n=1 Tax=bioreactor metagenome TaxID=1076179 RepID=A0A645ADK4_9ZZZZ